MKIGHRLISAISKYHQVSEDGFRVSENEDVFFACVIDGHGPPEQTMLTIKVVEMIGQELVDRSLVRDPDFQRIFDMVDQRLHDHHKHLNPGAVNACLHVDKVSACAKVAWCGDARVYAADPFNPFGYVQITTDHVPDHPNERKRINDLKATHVQVYFPQGKYPDRMGPGKLTDGRTLLSPSRGFGDSCFRPVYTHVPEIVSIDISGSPCVFVLCSDGGIEMVRWAMHCMRVNGFSPERPTLLEDLEKACLSKLSLRPKDDVTPSFFCKFFRKQP